MPAKQRHEESLASGATNLSLGAQGPGFEPRRGSLCLFSYRVKVEAFHVPIRA